MNVTNYYDKTLQTITGCAFEPVIVSDGITFLEFLYFFHLIRRLKKDILPAFSDSRLTVKGQQILRY